MKNIENISINSELVNYLFSRLAGAVPSLKYTADNEADTDRIMYEYSRAMIRHNITSFDLIDRSVDAVVDMSYKFLPPPGEFVSLCKEILRKDERMHEEEQKARDREQESLDNEAERKAIKQLRENGIFRPDIKMSDYISGRMSEYQQIMSSYNKKLETAKQKIIKSMQTVS